MKRFMSKKVAVVAASVALTLSMSGAAFAYFTSTGSGTGSAAVGSATAWTVSESGTPTVGSLFPDASIGGAHVQTHSYTVTNGGSGSQYLTSVLVKVANADGTPWIAVSGCSASDFSVGGAAVGTAFTDVALHGTFLAAQSKTNGSVTVEMIDSGNNQNACQGISIPLYFYAS